MKNNRVLYAALLLTLLTAAPVKSAQAFIRESPQFQADNTIIRSIDDSTWIIYSEHGIRGTFTMVHRTNLSTTVMDLGYRTITVSDFEIYGDMLFFCGSTIGQFPNKAVFGSIRLAGFPYIPVEYTIVDDFLFFKKMEILSLDRFLLIGENTRSKYQFIEVQQTFYPTNWAFGVYDAVPDYVDVLDDVAGNSQYAVFTGRNSSLDQGYIFFADYATYGWFSNSQPIQMLNYTYSVKSPLLLEYCESGAFATASLGDNNLLSVSAYIAPSHYSSQQAITGYGITDVADIKYKRNQQLLEVLTHHSDYELYYSQIFHFDNTLVYSSPSSVTGHRANDYWLSSVEEMPVYVPGGLNNMLSTGFNYAGNLCLFKYTPTYHNCMEKDEIVVREIEKSPQSINLSLTRKTISPQVIYLPTTADSLGMNTICN